MFLLFFYGVARFCFATRAVKRQKNQKYSCSVYRVFSWVWRSSFYHTRGKHRKLWKIYIVLYIFCSWVWWPNCSTKGAAKINLVLKRSAGARMVSLSKNTHSNRLCCPQVAKRLPCFPGSTWSLDKMLICTASLHGRLLQFDMQWRSRVDCEDCEHHAFQ